MIFDLLHSGNYWGGKNCVNNNFQSLNATMSRPFKMYHLCPSFKLLAIKTRTSFGPSILSSIRMGSQWKHHWIFIIVDRAFCLYLVDWEKQKSRKKAVPHYLRKFVQKCLSLLFCSRSSSWFYAFWRGISKQLKILVVNCADRWYPSAIQIFKQSRHMRKSKLLDLTLPSGRIISSISNPDCDLATLKSSIR